MLEVRRDLAGAGMTIEQAHALSLSLAEDGFSHTISIGVHDGMNPATQARVELRLRRIRGGTIGHAVAILETIADRHGLQLDSSLMGDDLTFNTPDDVRRIEGMLHLGDKRV